MNKLTKNALTLALLAAAGCAADTGSDGQPRDASDRKGERDAFGLVHDGSPDGYAAGDTMACDAVELPIRTCFHDFDEAQFECYVEPGLLTCYLWQSVGRQHWTYEGGTAAIEAGGGVSSLVYRGGKWTHHPCGLERGAEVPRSTC